MRVREYIKRNPHVWLALYLPVYILLFLLMERCVTDGYWASYLPLDDRIPFCEYFVVFYCAWHPLLIVLGLYLMFRDAGAFRRYMYFIMSGFTFCILFCFVFPNGQDLRPEAFPRDNVFSRLVGLIYAVDTNTNVLPSMHVVGCCAAANAVFDSGRFRSPLRRAGIIILTLLITLSTVLIKQHSALDVFAALALCLPLWLIVYGRRFLRKRERGAVRCEKEK